MKKPQVNAYLVIQSRGNPLKIDADELPRITNAMSGGKSVRVRQGIFNPSFYVQITEDYERIRDFNANWNSIAEHNKRDRDYNDGKHQRPLPEFKPLPDIFEGVPLQLDNGTKKLTG